MTQGHYWFSRLKEGIAIRKKIQQIIWIICVCLCLPLFWGMGAKPPLVGGPAPAFTLNDLEGHPVSLVDYQGKVVLLTFWATWCEPCKKEMPEIQKAHEQHKDHGFVVLAVNFGEKPEKAKEFVNQMALTFPIILDRKVEVASRYGVVSLPVSFFIDPNGLIRERVFGGTLTAIGISEVLLGLQEKTR